MKIQDKQSLFSNVNNSYNLYNLKAKVDFSQEELREILESQHLSFLTVKNYLADINHLANWYETEFKKPFSPQNLTPQIFDLFKEYLAQSGHSLKTVNRHSSSIHSLFKILKKQGLITKDPTEKAPLPAKEDSWHIKQFKDYLYVFGAADLTIKNYILDVQHFLDWAQRTIFASDFNVSEEYRFSRLPNLLPEYQERLLKIKGYSPASVKRKLSSLQKYLSWAAKEGYLKELPTKPSPIKPSPPSKIEVEEWPTVPKPRVFPLTHFLSAPIRIFNRFLSPLNLLFETLFITPLAGLILKVKNLIKRTPRFGVLPRPDFYAPPKVGFRGSKTPIFILIVLLLISLAGFSAYRLVLKKEAPPSEGIVSAGKNRTVAFAGKLTDTKGVPITKPVSVYFGLFPSQTTRDELWQETSQIIPDREGKFSVVLGEKTALPGSIFIENESLWLGIKVEGGEELKPRNQIPNVDLARNALYLRGAIPGTQVGANMVPILDSEGNLNLAAKSPSLTSTSGTFSLVGETLSLKTIDNGDIILSPAGRGGVDIQKAIFNSTDSGSVPGAVEIADILSILSTSSAQPAVSIRQDGAGDLLSAFFATQATDSAQISTQSAFIIKNTGFVGIGTSTPAQMLDVQGSLALGGNLYFTAGDLAFLNKSATESARLTEGGKFGLGITSPTSKLHVKGAIPGKALVIFDETGDQDIFVASASGTTKFRLSRTGNLFLAGEIDNTSGEELTLIDSLKVQGTNLTLGNGSAATIKTSNAQLTLDTGSNNTIILGTDDDLLPASSGTNDLGSSSLRWSNIYAVAENLSGDLAVNGGDITSTATTFNLLNEPTTLNIGSTAVARTINIGTGTLADTINIGTGGTSADTITIGNTGSLSLAGTVASSWNVTGANLTLQTTTSGTLALTSAGALNLTGAAASTWSVTSGGLTINSTSANLALQTTTSGNITLAPASTGSVQITSGTTTGTGTSSGLSVAANSLQSGTALDVSSTSTAGTASGSDILLNLSRSGANANLSHTAYGIYSAVTNTNATSGTNIGGYFSASGATTANYGLIVAAGSVGIGDTTPDAALEVLSTTEQLRLTYTDGTVDSRFTVDSSGNLTIDNTGTKTVIADDLQVTGNDILSSTATALTLSGADVTVAGALTVDGNTTLGNSSTVDTLTGNLLTSSITSGATTQTAFAITASSLTTGEILDLTGTFAPTAGGTQSAIDINLTNSPVTNANTLRGIDIGFTDAGTLANTVYGLYVDATTANASDTTYAAILTGGNVGLGDTTPDAALEVLSTTEQLRLTYTDGTVDSRFTVDSSGNLTIDNTGTKTVIADDLQINGGDILDSNGNEYLRFTTTASAVNELTITNAAASGTVTLAATGGDTNIPFSIDAKGSGALNLNNTATGDVLIAGGSGATGCTITNSNGNLACSGNITGGSTGTVGYWTRTTTTLSPATANDVVSISSNDTTNAVLALTATGATANAFTLTADSVTTGTVFALSADALTTGKGLDLTSTSNAIDSGVLLNVSSSLTAATDTTLSADIANFSFSPTYSTAVTTPAISGQVLDISRSVTTNNLFASTLTVSGALVSISDTSTQTTGTLTHTANVLSLTQNYTSSTGDVLSISNAGSGDAIEIGGAGTRSINSTSGNLTIKTTTSGNIILDSAGNILDIDDATISLATQATDFDIIDNSSTALTISEGTNNYLLLNTANDVTIVTLDTPVAGTTSTTGNLFTAAVNKTVNISDSLSTNTIDIGGVTNSGTDTISIATEGTAADAITIGNTNASTTLALTGGDDWSMAATGILTMSASATQTTAILITDTDYTNALSIGDNNITGTTANIDLTYFDVTGSSGAVTIAGNGLAEGTNALAVTLGAVTLTDGDLVLSSGEISATSDDASGTAFSFTGVSTTGTAFAVADTSLTTGTLASFTFTESLTATGTTTGLSITPTLAGTNAANTYTTNTFSLANVAGSCPALATCTTNGLIIGTGYTNDINFSDTTPTIQMADGGTLTIRDSAANALMTLADSGTSGTLTVTTINAFAAGGNIDMGGNIISNIGSTDTDFNTSGGLTITLDAAPATAALVINNSTQASNIFQAQDNGTAVMTIIDGGNVGIGTTAPGTTLDVTGTGRFSSSVQVNDLGIGVASSPTIYSLYLEKTRTDPGGITGMYTHITANPSAAMSGNFNGNWIRMQTSVNSATNNILSMRGMYIDWSNSVTGGATVESQTGIYLDNISQTTTATNQQLYLGTVTNGANNYGIYFAGNPSSGSIASGASTHISIMPGSGGNVGIGTTTPGTRLHVYTGGTDTNLLVRSASDHGAGYSGVSVSSVNTALTANKMLVLVGDPVVFPSFAGNVGIGTTGPLYELQVRTGTNENLQVRSTDSPTGGVFLNSANDADSSAVRLHINGIPLVLNNESGGNVGIGTTSPSTRLDIKSSAVDSNPFQITAAADSDILANFVESSAGDARLIMYRNGNLTPTLINTNGNSYFQGGNVGIGTTGPSYKLHIEKSFTSAGDYGFYMTDSESGASAGYFGISEGTGGVGAFRPMIVSKATGAGNTVGFQIRGVPIDDGTAGDTAILLQATNATQNAATSNANILQVTNYATTALTIDKSGNVGIGTTGPSRTLDVYNNTNVYSGYAIPAIFETGDLGNNFTIIQASSTAYTWYRSTSRAHDWMVGSETNALGDATFRIARVTEGNPITNTVIGSRTDGIKIEPVNLNVGIGLAWDTVPGSKLQVNGNAAIGYSANTAGPSNGLAVSGNVGIGTTAPVYRLQVSETTGLTIGLSVTNTTANGYAIYGVGQASGATGVYGTAGNAINTAYGVYGTASGTSDSVTPTYGVYAYGSNVYTNTWALYCNSLWVSGCGGNRAWNNTSDIRLKENVLTIPNALDRVLKLRGVTFDWKDSGQKDMGFIAQEVLPFVPEVIGKDREYYTMRASQLTALLVEAIKEQQAQIASISAIVKDINLTSTGDLVISKSENSVNQSIGISDNQNSGTSDLLTSTGSLINRLTDTYRVTDATGQLISRIGAFAQLAVANLRVGAANIYDLTSNNLTAQKIISPLAQVDEIHTNVISPLASDNLVIHLGGTDGNTPEVCRGRNPTSGVEEEVPCGKLIVENASGSAVATIDSSGNASFSGELASQQLTTNEASISGTLRARKILADEIEGATLSAQYITNNYTVVSPTPTPEVSLASPSASNSSTSGVNSSLPTFPNGLMAFGPVSVYDLSVAGNFYLGTNLVFSASTTSLDTLGTDLNIQGLRQGGIAFVGGQVYIDPLGNLRVGGNLDVAKDVTVRGNLAANIISPLPNQDLVISLMRSDLPGGPTSEGTSDGGKLIVKNASGSAVLTVNQQGSLTSQGDLTASGSGTFAKLNLFSSPVLALSDTEVVATSSAGQAAIKAGTTELTIRNSLVTQNSLIYVTPIASGTAQPAQSLYLLRQQPEVSFTVGANSPVNADTPFNWLIIN